jgi:hypothetical protein
MTKVRAGGIDAIGVKIVLEAHHHHRRVATSDAADSARPIHASGQNRPRPRINAIRQLHDGLKSLTFSQKITFYRHLRLAITGTRYVMKILETNGRPFNTISPVP